MVAGFWPEIAQDEICQVKNGLVFKKEEILLQWECNTLILLKIWLYKKLLETIYLLKDNKVALIIFRHLKPFLK
jgi:hypothetical protein